MSGAHLLAAAVLIRMVFATSLVQAESIPYLRCFELAGERHQVPLNLLLGVARVESGFDPDARSPADAHGIMQIRWPVTARHLGVHRVSELYNPCLNIDLGARYLAELLERYQNNDTLALAAYNYGPSRLRVEADIPRRVVNYVERVRFASAAHEQTGAEVPPGGSQVDILLNEFSSRHRALLFSRSVNSIISRPSAYIQKVSVHAADTRYRVLLNGQQLSGLDRVRLARIFNLEETTS